MGMRQIWPIRLLMGSVFRFLVVPSWDEESSTFCFHYIGQDALSLCMSQNCGRVHPHASVKKVMPGMLYITKYLTTAFVTPLIITEVINGDILTEWKTLSLSLPEWNEKCFIATAALDGVTASTAAMEVNGQFF
jgi:hypothetical protein